MDALYLMLLAVLGLLGGVLSGVVGVGGGIIFVPALVYAAGWKIQEAVAASLVLVVFSSVSGTLRNLRGEDPIDWRTTGILSAAVAPAALVGVFISYVSPKTVVEVAFAVLLLALAYPTARGRSEQEGGTRKIPLPLVLLAGAGVGALSGLVGIGGGALLVPLMILGLGFSTKGATSSSLAVILSTGLVGAGGYLVTGYGYLLASLPPLIVGALIGAWVGVRIRDFAPEGVVRRGFGVLMAVVALRTLAGAAGIF